MTTDLDPYQVTSQYITHRGIRYQILHTDDPQADSTYGLRSPRGHIYMLLRNKPNPHALFAIGFTSKLRNLPGWFSDKSGELVSCDP
jgi:hypothetical protein